MVRISNIKDGIRYRQILEACSNNWLIVSIYYIIYLYVCIYIYIYNHTMPWFIAASGSHIKVLKSMSILPLLSQRLVDFLVQHWPRRMCRWVQGGFEAFEDVRTVHRFAVKKNWVNLRSSSQTGSNVETGQPPTIGPNPEQLLNHWPEAISSWLGHPQSICRAKSRRTLLFERSSSIPKCFIPWESLESFNIVNGAYGIWIIARYISLS